MTDLEDRLSGALGRVADAVDVRADLAGVRREVALGAVPSVDRRPRRLVAAAAAAVVAVGLVAAAVVGAGSAPTDPLAEGPSRAYPVVDHVADPLVDRGEASIVGPTAPVAQSSAVLVGRRRGRGILDGAVLRAVAVRPPSLDPARGVRSTFGERGATRFVEAGVTTYVLDGEPSIVISGSDPSWLAAAHVSLSTRTRAGVPELLVGPLPRGAAIVVVGPEGPTRPSPTVSYAGASGGRLLLWTTLDDPRLAIGAIGDLQPVTIGRRAGWMVSRPGATVLAWKAGPGVTVVVDTSLPQVAAERLAAEVRLVDGPSWRRRYGLPTSSTATTKACPAAVATC